MSSKKPADFPPPHASLPCRAGAEWGAGAVGHDRPIGLIDVQDPVVPKLFEVKP
jgi:hypothetical protein